MTAIHVLLEQTATALQEFLALLATERKTLIAGDADQLAAITAEKSRLATHLASLDTERNAALRTAGFAAGRGGLDAWLVAGTPPTGAVRALLRQYRELAAAAKRENELNGKLIAAQMQQNQQALAALLGQAADATPYGADGQQKSSSGRRPLGRA